MFCHDFLEKKSRQNNKILYCFILEVCNPELLTCDPSVVNNN